MNMQIISEYIVPSPLSPEVIYPPEAYHATTSALTGARQPALPRGDLPAGGVYIDQSGARDRERERLAANAAWLAGRTAA